MEADALSPVGLGLLLLPFLVTLLAALCVRCREFPSKWGALGTGCWVLRWMLIPSQALHSLTVPISVLLGGRGLSVLVPSAPHPASFTLFPPASYDSASTER